MTDHRIATGEIGIDLHQGDALAQIDRVVSEVKAKVDSLRSTRADIPIDANAAGLDKSLADTKLKLERLERQKVVLQLDADSKKVDNAFDRVKAKILRMKAEKAELVVGANLDKLEKELVAAELKAKRLSATKAEIKVSQQGARKAVVELEATAAALKAVSDAQDKVTVALDKNNRIKTLKGLEDAKEAVRIAALAKAYKDLGNQLEKSNFKKSGFGSGSEKNIELGLDDALFEAKRRKILEELRLLGAHRTIARIETTDAGTTDRLKVKIESLLSGLGGKIGNFGKLRLSLGPISGSIGTLSAVVAAALPLVTSLTGALVSLVGVASTGVLGAGAIGGGIFTGLVTNLAGVRDAVKHVSNEFTEASKAQEHYEKAVNHFGSGSKQALKAHQELLEVVEHINPATEQAVIIFRKLEKQWDKLILPKARFDIGRTQLTAVTTLQTLLPGLAQNSNKTLDLVSQHLDAIFVRLRRPAEAKGFLGLGESANKFLGPALGGLERFGFGILHVFESAARIFAGPLGKAIFNIGKSFNEATVPGEKLDKKIEKLGHDAESVIGFFTALGRVIADVLSGGSVAGKEFADSMTGGLEKWDRFLKGTRGKNEMAKFFHEAVKGTEGLWAILAPLSKLLFTWAAGLTPAVNTFLKLADGATKFIVGLGKMIGFKSPLAELGAVIGGIFFVSKIATFTSAVGGAIRKVKELGALKSLGALFTGGSIDIGGKAAGVQMGAAIETASGVGAAEMGGAIEAAGASAAAEIGAAMGLGGVPAGPGGVIKKGKTVVKDIVKVVEPAAAGAGGAGAAEGALSGLTSGVRALTLGIAGLGAAALVIGLHFLGGPGKIGKYAESLSELGRKYRDSAKGARQLEYAQLGIRNSLTDLGSATNASNLGLKEAKKRLDETKGGTIEHEQAELQYNEALRNNIKLKNEWKKAQTETHASNTTAITQTRERVTLEEKAESQAKVAIENSKITGNKDAQAKAEKNLTEIQKERAKEVELLNRQLNIQAAEEANLARAFKGLPALSNAGTEAVGNLARKGGAGLARTVATKFSDPAEVQAVATQASRDISKGVPVSKVLKLIVDARDAKGAVASLASALSHLPLSLTARVQAIVTGSADLNKLTGSAREAKEKVIAHILEMRDKAESEVKNLSKSMGPGIRPGTHAVEKAFGNMIKVVEAELAAGVLKTKDAMHKISDLLQKELEGLGVKDAGPKIEKGAGDLGAKALKGLGAAKGGLIQFGRAGQAGMDNIPVNMGGIPIEVGAGEQGAVFTKQQQAVANAHLAPVGGLAGLFNNYATPHYMAKGGFTEAYPGKQGRIDQGVDYAGPGPVRAVLDGTVQSVGLWHGWPGTGGLVYSTARGLIYVMENFVSLVKKGQKVVAGQIIGMDTGGRYGIETGWANSAGTGPLVPYNGLPDGTATAGGKSFASFIGSGIGGAIAAAFKKIAEPKVGGHGLIGKVAQAAVHHATTAANKHGEALAKAAGAGLGELPGGATGGHAAGTKQMRAWAAAGLKSAGVAATPGNISTIVYTMSRESGGNPRSENTTDSNARAGHPSRGLMELIPENFKKYHQPGTSNNVFDPVANVAAAVRYMIARYGHIVGKSPYAKGGMVPSGRYDEPALLIGEHAHEYVIDPKNPAGPEYLKAAGEEMGYDVTAAKVQKAPKYSVKGAKPTRSASGTISPKQEKELHTPAPYAAGAIPEAQIAEIVTNIEGLLGREETKFKAVQSKRDKDSEAVKAAKHHKGLSHDAAKHSAVVTVENAREALHRAEAAPKSKKDKGQHDRAVALAKGKLGKAESQAAYKTQKADNAALEKLVQAEKSLKGDKDFLKLLDSFKGGVGPDHIKYTGLKKLKTDLKLARGDRNKIAHFNEEIKGLNDDIANDRTRLEIISKKWAKHKGTEGPALLAEWNKILGKRGGEIKNILGKTSTAHSEAVKHEKIFDSPAMKELITTLDNQQVSLESTAQEQSELVEQQGPEAGPAAREGPPTAEEYIKELGGLPYLQAMERDYAVAQTDNLPDNPNTPQNEEIPTIINDRDTAKKLEDFWEDALRKGQASGQEAPTIKDLAGQVTSSRSVYQGLLAQIETGEKGALSQSIADTTNFSLARQELFKNYGSNFAPTWAQAAPAAPAAHPVAGAAGTNPATQQPPGKTVTINNTNHFSTPPPDPHHWSSGVAWELQAAI